MAMAKRKRNTSLLGRFVKLFASERVREVSCTECGRPYLEHAERAPTHRISCGDVELLLYAQHSWRKRSYGVRVGAWRSASDGYRLFHLLNEFELPALLDVVSKAVEFVDAEGEVEPEKSSRKQEWIASGQYNSKQ